MIKVSIAENLEDVEKRISAAAKRSGRKREDITLVAVTKTHPAEMMNEAIKLGVTDIGENKPQEVRDKYDSVLPAKWHLIGHLQTNKVKYVIDKVCLIHSVDSIKLMDEIERQAEKHNLDMDILIQVNISGEETKSGISKEEVEDFYDDWEVEEFSANKIVLVKEISSLCDEHFIIKLGEKYVQIFHLESDGNLVLYKTTDISRDYLPAEDIAKLEQGMYVFGEGKLNSIIEDFE